jgi:uroporphyrinogen decarboxylase
MTGRDRVLAALGGQVPDRIPLALSFFDVNGSVLASPGEWRDDLVDVAFVSFPVSTEEAVLRRWAMPFDGNTRIGSVAQAARYASWHYHPEREARGNPLEAAATLQDLERFPFPDVKGTYVSESLAHQVEVIHALGLAAAGNLPHLGGEMFEAAWRLRGFENFMLDLVERKDMAHFLLDRLADLACRNAAALARAGVDVLALDDDVGMPGSMMISPATWREFFRPRLTRIIEAAHAARPGVRIAYHSDGYIEPILDDLVDLGVNALNPVQPEYMDAIRIRRRFGPRLALWGTVGRQTTFAFADPDEIRTEVRERIETLGPAGLVLSPAYDIDEPDVPWANVAAFLDAGREWGAAARR